MGAQINMDIDAMVLPTSDGKKYVREFHDSSGVELGYTSHNVYCKMTMKLKTCRNKHRVFTWNSFVQECARVIDREMNGKLTMLFRFLSAYHSRSSLLTWNVRQMVFHGKEMSIHQALHI